MHLTRALGISRASGESALALSAAFRSACRPLWEMWLIEGAARTDACDHGLLAVMTKIHHAAADGVSAASLLAQLCSVTSDAAPPDAVKGPGDASALRIAAGGLLNFTSRPLRLANLVPTTASTMVKTLRRAASGQTMAPPFTAPPTAFNTALTTRRNIAVAELDLQDIKTVKNRFGVKVNDVVMALCAGVLRLTTARRRTVLHAIANLVKVDKRAADT